MITASDTWPETIRDDVARRQQHLDRLRDAQHGLYTGVNLIAGVTMLGIVADFVLAIGSASVLLVGFALVPLVAVYFVAKWCIEVGGYVEQSAVRQGVALAWERLELKNWLQVQDLNEAGMLLPWQIGNS